MRESIIIYRSFYDAIKELEPLHQAEIWKAVFEYGLNQNQITLSGLPSTIFTLIKPQLDANIRKYENGTKGGRPKKPTESEDKPKNNLTETKVKPNVNDNVNENENKNVNENKKFKPPTLVELKNEFPNMDTESFHDFYTSKGWKVGKDPMKDWRAAARNWQRRNNPQTSFTIKNRATLNDD
jgi:hypothetical protein